MEVFTVHLGMNVSEEDEEVHGYASPVRSVVYVSLTKMSGEQSLLVCLVQAGTSAPCNTCLRLESLFHIIPHHSCFLTTSDSSLTKFSENTSLSSWDFLPSVAPAMDFVK